MTEQPGNITDSTDPNPSKSSLSSEPPSSDHGNPTSQRQDASDHVSLADFSGGHESHNQTSLNDTLNRQLPPAIKKVWLARSCIAFAVWVIIVTVAFGVCMWFSWWGTWQTVVALTIVALSVINLVTTALLLNYNYRFTRYQIDQDTFSVQKGYFFRTLTVVPYTRVQHMESEQGPLLRHYGLVSLTVSTAVDTHEIPGLTPPEAQSVLEQITSLVKQAKEDV